ncbi:hypothetical protein SK066_10990 [Paenibacillus hunanensis]|uniref:hypothetical protein n=1 Tax=Paenibacillus hunanensis TaxID=539262 RepID=UPI002A6A40D8|nr:hypothetical protein [Paenibacillus hunanensis]WPP43422.1 hypothetical protein SK066_10990 [Paenibacillus hunanensis]
MLIILLLGCIIIAWIAPGKKWPAAPTAAGSMVMALGIYMQGVWTYASGQAPQSFLSRVLILGIVLVWLYLLASYVTSIRLATFYRDHLADPVQRFAVGTWVAGTATLLINLYSSFQIAWLQESIHIMATLNIALWLFYICYAIMGWYRLMIDTSSARVDGTVLLPAVATQSLVLLCHQVFALSLGKGFTRSFIIVGLVCYAIGISIMIWRYYRSTTWNIEAWKITNCIVYGALAISGAAISLTEAWSGQVAYMLWWIVLLLVIFIESVEAAYAIKRIRQHGWRHGVGRYHTAQWTRLFTLGMFYFLTLHTIAPAANPSFTQILHHIVLVVGAWGITLLLIVELGLWLYTSMIGHRLLKEDGE